MHVGVPPQAPQAVPSPLQPDAPAKSTTPEVPQASLLPTPAVAAESPLTAGAVASTAPVPQVQPTGVEPVPAPKDKDEADPMAELNHPPAPTLANASQAASGAPTSSLSNTTEAPSDGARGLISPLPAPIATAGPDSRIVAGGGGGNAAVRPTAPVPVPAISPPPAPQEASPSASPIPGLEGLTLPADPLSEPHKLPRAELPEDGIPPELAALSSQLTDKERVDIAARHYLHSALLSSAVAQVLVSHINVASTGLAVAKVEHVRLTNVYFTARKEAALAAAAGCKREVVVLSDLEAQTVSDADRLAVKASTKGEAVFNLGEITGVDSGSGAGAPPPVADGAAMTLAKISNHVITHVREAALEAAQASAHASEMAAVASAAQVQAADERAKLAAQRVSTAGSSSAS